jgi:acetyl-CoA C-acetyltransferase
MGPAAMSEAFIIAARRTPVAPRNGAFRHEEAWELGASVIKALVEEAGGPGRIDSVLMGNALYAGGNPARMAALAAGLPQTTAAGTIDTQCCAGLDAIVLAAALVRSGEAKAVVAGGLESWSRAPLRLRRPKAPGEEPQAYSRPPFAPWPDRDPDLIESAASLAQSRGFKRAAQALFAAESHAKALAADLSAELVAHAGLAKDAFPRHLSLELCHRLPLLAGDRDTGLTGATVAVEADAAAAVLVVDEAFARASGAPFAIRIVDGAQEGCDPLLAAEGAQAAARVLLARSPGGLDVCEIMESFAPQAMAAAQDIGCPAQLLNRGGGALARGHPIGASGAILAVRLFHELRRERVGARGLAAIAAAGGLGSALLLERV